MNNTIYLIATLFLFIGAWIDIKKGEVPDLITFWLGIIVVLLYYVIEPSMLYASMIGFALCFVLGYSLAHFDYWGGADAKILGSMGAVIGFDGSNLLLPAYLILIVVIGIPYSNGYKKLVEESKRKFEGVPFLPVFLLSLLGLLLYHNYLSHF